MLHGQRNIKILLKVIWDEKKKRRKQLLYDIKGKENILESGTGSTRWHSLRTSLWKKLWTRPKTDEITNELINCHDIFISNKLRVRSFGRL